jgi:hypothetical protein
MKKFTMPHLPMWYYWVGLTVVLLLLADWLFSVYTPFRGALIDIPVGFFFSLFVFAMYFMMYFGHLYVRSRSPIIITDSAIRQSANDIHPLAETDLGGDPFPPMALYLVGGGRDIGFAIADKDVMLVRKSAVEKLGRKVLIVHAPVQPMPGAVLAGLAGHESALAERAPHSAFAPKGRSMLLFSLLDSRHGIDSARLREEQDFVVKKSAQLNAETAKWSEAGSKRFVQELRGLALAIRKQTPRERLLSFFTTPKPGDEETQKQDEERMQ